MARTPTPPPAGTPVIPLSPDEATACLLLYTATRKPLLACLRRCLADRRVRDDTAAEELLQKLWFDILRSPGRTTRLLGGMAGPGLTAAGLARRARSAARNLARALRRRRWRERAAAPPPWDGAGELAQAAEVAEFLGTLPPGLRAVCEGLLGSAGAPGEGPSPEALWQQYHRLRERVRAYYAD